MKLKLDLRHRILYWNMLANFNSTNIATWKLIDEAKKMLGFGEGDYEKYSITVSKDASGVSQFHFKNEGTETEYEINDIVHQMVIDHLKERDSKKIMAEDEFHLAMALNLGS